MIISSIFLLLCCTLHATAFAESVPSFTDGDLRQYRGGPEPGPAPAPQPSSDNRKSGTQKSPQEKYLQNNREQVVQDNLDYIEAQYTWMKNDCAKYEGEFRKDCLFRTGEWRREQIQRTKELDDHLRK